MGQMVAVKLHLVVMVSSELIVQIQVTMKNATMAIPLMVMAVTAIVDLRYVAMEFFKQVKTVMMEMAKMMMVA
jgi:hypothetical protein